MRQAFPAAQPKTRHWGVVSLGLALLLGCSVASAEQIKKKVPTADHPSLLLRSHNGMIVVKGWDQPEVEIAGERYSSAMDVLISGEQEKVTVEARPVREGLSAEEKRVDFRIWVPRQATLRMDSDHCEVSVEDLAGNVSIEGVSSSVSLSGIRGHITVRTLEGPIVVRNSEGHVKISSISGDLRFVQVNGPELIATSNSGTIRYEGDFGSGGTYVLNNYSSPIYIITSEKASFDLTARAVQGQIESSLPFRPIPLRNPFRRTPPGKFLQGRYNSGRATVQVTSYSGTIRLEGAGSPAGIIP